LLFFPLNENRVEWATLKRSYAAGYTAHPEEHHPPDPQREGINPILPNANPENEESLKENHMGFNFTRFLRVLGKYLIQLLAAVALPIVTSFLIAAIPFFFLRQTVIGRAADILISEPAFPLTVALAAFFGWRINARTRTPLAALVFIVPLAAMIANLASFRAEGSSWRYIVDTFFTSHCGASDCMYELEVTVPLYCSIAYSIAAALVLGRSKKGVIGLPGGGGGAGGIGLRRL
jgi:hypothetical protein